MDLILNKLSWILTGLSILGGSFVILEKKENRRIGFIIWIIANIGWIIFNTYHKHYSAVILFSIYTFQSAIGMIKTFGHDNFLRWFTWLMGLNFFVLQWFFIRLGYYRKEIKGPYYTKYVKKYKIMWWVLPLTGWWSDYKFFKWGRK